MSTTDDSVIGDIILIPHTSVVFVKTPLAIAAINYENGLTLYSVRMFNPVRNWCYKSGLLVVQLWGGVKVWNFRRKRSN